MELITLTGEEPYISDHDLAVLADWASMQRHTAKADEQKGYSLLREGADFIIRRRARSRGDNNKTNTKEIKEKL